MEVLRSNGGNIVCAASLIAILIFAHRGAHTTQTTHNYASNICAVFYIVGNTICPLHSESADR